MKSILELSDVEARRYFIESSNYCSLDLPKYIDFLEVLAYVEDKVEIIKYHTQRDEK